MTDRIVGLFVLYALSGVPVLIGTDAGVLPNWSLYFYLIPALVAALFLACYALRVVVTGKLP